MNVAAQQQDIFNSNAGRWWDTNGPMQALHALTSLRLDYLASQVRAHGLAEEVTSEQGQGPGRDMIWQNRSVLDIGCGAGLISEPLARLKAEVTGMDASVELIAEARRHAATSGVSVTYTNDDLSKLAVGSRFDLVLLLELLEHVAPGDRGDLLFQAASAIRPGGLMVLSTLNRSMKSHLLAIKLAENVFRWLPKGTHNSRWFIKPAECAKLLRNSGLRPLHCQAVAWAPGIGWHLRPETSPVNYFFTAIKPS